MFRWYKELRGNEKRTFWACFGGWATDALDVQIYSFVIPAVSQDDSVGWPPSPQSLRDSVARGVQPPELRNLDIRLVFGVTYFILPFALTPDLDPSPLRGRIGVDKKLENVATLDRFLKSPAAFDPLNDGAVCHGDRAASDHASTKN